MASRSTAAPRYRPPGGSGALVKVVAVSLGFMLPVVAAVAFAPPSALRKNSASNRELCATMRKG